jgi:hypothetical protein
MTPVMKACVRPANIASLAMLTALLVTFIDSAPDWAIWLVPFWMVSLCYLNLERLYALIAATEGVPVKGGKSGARAAKAPVRRTHA